MSVPHDVTAGLALWDIEREWRDHEAATMDLLERTAHAGLLPSNPDPTPLIAPARAAMVALYRSRVRRAPTGYRTRSDAVLMPWPTVSAIDLAEWLDARGWAGDRRFSGKVWTTHRGLWVRHSFIPNPRRHSSPTPTFELNETRAKELQL